MKVLIDADGCPVTKLTVETARKYEMKAVVVCDTAHIFDFSKYSNVESVVVTKGADSADFALVNRVENGDIVITQDYGLAAMCLARMAKVINQNGLIYNDGNIDAMLMGRHCTKKARRNGLGFSSNAHKRKKEDDIRFLNALEALIKNT